jgi:hypothetical protein
MAKDDVEHSTSSPATPDLLSLNEAVALIVERLPPHDVLAVRTMIGNALVDDQLRDCGFALGGNTYPSRSKPDVWRHWLEAGQVLWKTGEVEFPPRDGLPGRMLKEVKPPPIRPLFRRQDVFDLFGIIEAPPSAELAPAPVEPPPLPAAAPDSPASAGAVVQHRNKRRSIKETRVLEVLRELDSKYRVRDGMQPAEVEKIVKPHCSDVSRRVIARAYKKFLKQPPAK